MQSQHSINEHPTDHEPIEVNTSAIWIAGACLGAIVAGGLAVVAGLIIWFAADEKVASDQREIQQVPMPADVPKLDANQPVQRLELRKRERQWLGSYGWVDQNAGVARIPISQAMARVASEGLPETPPPTDDTTTPPAAQPSSTENNERSR